MGISEPLITCMYSVSPMTRSFGGVDQAQLTVAPKAGATPTSVRSEFECMGKKVPLSNRCSDMYTTFGSAWN